jgi:predicted transcriptional regulator
LSPQTENILISIEHEHAINMLNGIKTAELRRRPLRIRPGTRVWIYSKLPRGHIELVAVADQVVAASPSSLWRRYGSRIAITYYQFKKYCAGAEVACVILLGQIEPLQPALCLAAIRKISKDFQPPQFFKRLTPDGAELHGLMASNGSPARKQ